MKRCLFFVALFLLYQSLLAQKPLVTDPVVAEAIVRTIVDSSLHFGDLKTFAEKNKVKGEFIIDITVQGRGEVVSVFCVKGDGDIPKQNRLLSLLRTLEFPMKLPKGKRYKVQCNLNFI